MKKIAIYVEGGGDTAAQKGELRIGFDELLSQQKQAARNKQLGWKLIPSGSRDDAYRAFINEIHHASPDTVCVLVVDSEEAVQAETVGEPELNAQIRKQHLSNRDGWELSDAEPEQIHLMVQCMEAWIVADPEALADYYARGFRPKSLPVRANLEEEPKAQIFLALAKATRETKKGEYSEGNKAKIKHASKLLAKLDPKRVSARCPRFATFTAWLEERIKKA